MDEPIYLERGTKRVFACAINWPGWCRVDRDEDAAVATLAAYASRYAVVTEAAGVPFPAAEIDELGAGAFDVVEVAEGSGTTDFGAPAAIPAVDGQPLDGAEAERQADLVAASWDVLDRVVAGSSARLRKGPRGGGRDRDQIVAHVVEAERAYARKLGVRFTPTELAADGGLAAMRGAIIGVLRGAGDGGPLVDRGWPARYGARRIAWHVLDHAWEIEDKREG